MPPRDRRPERPCYFGGYVIGKRAAFPLCTCVRRYMCIECVLDDTRCRECHKPRFLPCLKCARVTKRATTPLRLQE